MKRDFYFEPGSFRPINSLLIDTVVREDFCYKVVEDPDGTKYYYAHGLLHRENGPAIEWSDGTRWWCKKGKFHRCDGPAVESSSGRKEWWVDGKMQKALGSSLKNCEFTHVILKSYSAKKRY